MKIKDKKTGYYYAGFDSARAAAVWVKNKVESTRIADAMVPQAIRQLTLLQYDVEEAED